MSVLPLGLSEEGEPVRVVVGKDSGGWHERFSAALGVAASKHPTLEYRLEELGGHDWIERVRDADVVLWNPVYMGPVAASHFKEKVYFLETFMRKRVIPNYSSIWHFESKIAQSYLLEHFGLSRPRTWVSFEWNDALGAAEDLGLPLVAKESYGAASSNVRLLRTNSEVKRYVTRHLYYQRWLEKEKTASSRTMTLLGSMDQPWLWYTVVGRLTGSERVHPTYFQRYIEGNAGDVRVTVIGSRAYVFGRANRPDDFRASGSGLIDYDLDVDHALLRKCITWSKEMGFDSMAYDILFEDGQPLVVEMSYSYVASALAAARGHWLLCDDGTLEYIEGPVWPQDLWVGLALDCTSSR